MDTADEAHRIVDAGVALMKQGQLDAALQRFADAARLAPTLGRPRLAVGNVHLARGDVEGAVAAYESALQIQPHYPGAHFNIGRAHLSQGRLDLARAAFERAIAQDPRFVDARIARASVLDDQRLHDDAIAAYRDVLREVPEHADVRCDLAYILSRRGRFVDALSECRTALASRPGFTKARRLEASLLADMGRLDEAIERYRALLDEQPDSIAVLSRLLFVSNYRASAPDPQLVSLARRCGERLKADARAHTTWNTDPGTARVLRVGLVSGDLREHPVAWFLASTLEAIAAQSPKRVTLFAYSSSLTEDATTRRIQALVDEWRLVANLSDEALAARIADDRIDILIDLSGHTAGSRLPVFAWKPAPVQASWLGYFATTGLDTIDWFVADPWTVPSGEDADFVERLWRLPETRLCFSAPHDPVEVAELPALANGVVTFGSFNHLAKMSDAVVALWSRILLATPGSRLLLKSPPLADPPTRAATIARFAAHGVAAERILTEGLSPRHEYFAAYGRVDIALDPFPYPGGTTTAEGLWMGVPIVTMAGHRFLARQGSGFLKVAGLDDWIAQDEDDYLRIAMARANDVAALAALRRGLRARVLASPLFDAPRFAGHFVDALQAMWERRR